jgi:hypothetical protein
LLITSVSEGANTWIAGNVKSKESEFFEITGETAEAIFAKLENIKGKETSGVLSKVGKNIECSRFRIDPKIKDKDYSYKCYFQVGKNGELEPPKPAAGLTPAS